MGAETSYRVAKNVIKKIHSGNIQVDLEVWLTVGSNANKNGLDICLKCRNFWLNIMNLKVTSKC